MKVVLDINPQTWVRIVSGKHGDHVLFNIPEVCFKGEDEAGEPTGGSCDEYFRTGLCRHTLSPSGRARKRRIEKYNKYRVDLFTLAKEAGFQLPTCGWALYFYIPVPKRWSKKKKAAMHGQMHLQKPDESNLLKAFEDSLSIVDEQVAQMSGLGKFWVNQEKGYVEILTSQGLYNPFGVEFIDQHKFVTMEDLESRREKRNARKEEIRAKKKEDKKNKVQKPAPAAPDKFRKFRKTDKII